MHYNMDHNNFLLYILLYYYYTDLSNIKAINPNSSLVELGMDSVIIIELKQTLEREFNIFFTAKEIRNLTFGNFIKMSV